MLKVSALGQAGNGLPPFNRIYPLSRYVPTVWHYWPTIGTYLLIAAIYLLFNPIHPFQKAFERIDKRLL